MKVVSVRFLALALAFLCLGGVSAQDDAGPPPISSLRLVAQTSCVGGIKSACWSPDGNWVLTSDGGGAIKVWEAQSGFLILSIQGGSSPYLHASFSPDGRKIFAYVGGSTRLAWDSITGKPLKAEPMKVKHEVMLSGSDSQPIFASSPYGDKVGLIAGGSFKLIDDMAKQPPVSLKGLRGRVLSASLSSDGAFLITGGADGHSQVWDVGSGKLLKSLSNPWPVVSTSLSADDKEVLATASDGESFVWDIDSGRFVAVIIDSDLAVKAVKPHVPYAYPELSAQSSFSPDGSLVLVACGNAAEVWRAKGNNRVSVLEGDSITFGHMLGFKTSTPSGYVESHVPGLKDLNPSRQTLTVHDDGSARILSKTGKELCKLYVFKDGTWAVVDPSNRYDGPNGGHVGGLHWVRNGTSPMGLDQLRFAYYTPGLLEKILKAQKLPEIPK